MDSAQELSRILDNYNSGEATFSTAATLLVELAEKVGSVIYDFSEHSDVINCAFNDATVDIDYTDKTIVKK